MIQEAIQRLVDGRGLTREEARGVMDQIMSGAATDAQIGAFLVALRCKGESVDEIAGCAQAMREKATRVQTSRDPVIDTCGTGGDGSGTFNISTTVAFVAAGAGLCVAKHGNRAMSSRCGSADVLQALGVDTEIGPDKVGKCLDEAGIGFLFAPMLHGAMKHAIGPRREIGARTVFNALGPLTNPAGARRQLIGVYDGGLTEKLAGVLNELGSERAFVVHGSDGMDEITLAGMTRVSELNGGRIETYEISPGTSEEWEAVENAAFMLAESGNLLLLEERAQGQGHWVAMSRAMIDVGRRAVEAAQARDPDAVFETGGDIYLVCTGCHAVYAAETLRPNYDPGPDAP